MKGKIWLAVISGITFALGITLASYAVTSSSGGVAKVSAGGFSFEIQINEIDLEKIIKNKRDDAGVKEIAKETFGLYEIDSDLVKEISTLAYDIEFSGHLRELRDRFIGPFNAPDINVEVSFKNTISSKEAEVCPDSIFYRNRINIALSDFSNMDSIDQANIAIVHGCPTPHGKPVPIVISSDLGKKLLGTEQLPNTLTAVAKVLPSYVISK